MGNLDFGLLGTPESFQTSDYKSAGSNQAENLNYELVTDSGTYEEIFVVPTGKTYYVSAMFVYLSVAGPARWQLATGAAAAEVDNIVGYVAVTTPVEITFSTPVKFASGTRLSVGTDNVADCQFTLVGWTE